MALELGPAPQLGRFQFSNSPWGCTFYFLVRILSGKWRWSWVQRQMLHFFIRGEIKKFTKRVAVRAMELSIGAFCTQFRCEQLCDDDIFLDRDRILIFREKGRRESSEALDHCILHRISVRIQPWGRYFSSPDGSGKGGLMG